LSPAFAVAFAGFAAFVLAVFVVTFFVAVFVAFIVHPFALGYVCARGQSPGDSDTRASNFRPQQARRARIGAETR